MPAINSFDGVAEGINSPPARAESVTPNDAADLGTVSRCFWVGTAGDIRVTLLGMADGTSVILKGAAAGMWHPGRIKRVWATQTTAADIVAGH